MHNTFDCTSINSDQNKQSRSQFIYPHLTLKGTHNFTKSRHKVHFNLITAKMNCCSKTAASYFPGGPVVTKSPPANVGRGGGVGLIPGWGRSHIPRGS